MHAARIRIGLARRMGRDDSRHEEITAIRDRIAVAETDRETWRVAGLKAQYVEAYFKVEALERQLDLRLCESG